jgi:hypothetical protein
LGLLMKSGSTKVGATTIAGSVVQHMCRLLVSCLDYLFVKV